jgi:phage tail sheath protein FI
MMPIGIIGTASGTALPNTLIRIRSESDLAQFGTVQSDDTLLPGIRILQRYGCGNIIAIKAPKGANNDATATNIAGTENAGVRTGLKLFKDSLGKFGFSPRWLLVPVFGSSIVVIDSGVEVATNIGAFIALDFSVGSSMSNVRNIREGGTNGLGNKSAHLYPCVPHVIVGSTIEPLSHHLVGSQAVLSVTKGFGFTTSNMLMPIVTGIEPGFTLSYTDANADNQQLERLGCTTVNRNANGYVIWGNRNASFQTGISEGWETYITLNRVKQELNLKFIDVGIRFIDEPCNLTTAMLLGSALNNVILDNSSQGNYSNLSSATLNNAKTDFRNRKLVYDILILCNLPTEVIELYTTYTVTF